MHLRRQPGTVRAMARAHRPLHAGLYHVATGSTRPDPFFRDDIDRGAFLVELVAALRHERAVCLGLCLLTTHYHLILDVDEGALPRMMQRINWRYARAVNRRHHRLGHVVGRPYLSAPILDDAHLLTGYRYLAWNLVRAGVVKRPQDTRWSSYATTVGLRRDYSFVDARRVVGMFGRPYATATQRLRGFVEAPTGASEPAPWPPRVARLAA